MTINAAAEVLAADLVSLLQGCQVHSTDLVRVQQQVAAPRGHEERVIEGLFRCIITEHLRIRYRLPLSVLPSSINSSHTSVRQACGWSGHGHSEAYAEHRWKEFRKRFPVVDSYEERPGGRQTLHRADLFIVAAASEVVSLEFKHIGPMKAPNCNELVKQMRRYVRHAASILVLYGARPLARDILEVATSIQRDLPSTMRVVPIEGPSVQVGS